MDVWIFGWRFGLDAFVEHFILRFFLSQRGGLPWKLIPFLDEAKERLLLHKAGGSYRFAHRLLQDYFVALDESISSEKPSSEGKIKKQDDG